MNYPMNTTNECIEFFQHVIIAHKIVWPIRIVRRRTARSYTGSYYRDCTFIYFYRSTLRDYVILYHLYGLLFVRSK